MTTTEAGLATPLAQRRASDRGSEAVRALDQAAGVAQHRL